MNTSLPHRDPMSDISLLPEEQRGKEAAEKHETVPPKTVVPGLKMHIPESTADEDIEIIEVDESDLGAILADEPLFTRVSYQLSSWLDKVKQQLFQKQKAPPPKLPPQFFTPPKSGLVTPPPRAATLQRPGSVNKVGEGRTAGVGATPRARITPQETVPHRVRVIRRIRKPVRISLLSEEELLAFQVDVPRRQWTLGVISVLFILIIGGGFALLTTRTAEAESALASLDGQLNETRNEIRTRESEWSVYRDLQYRLTVLDTILDRHIVLTRALDFLERNTMPEVYYRSATIDPIGLISLDVVADSYESAARQLVAFERNPLVLRVESLSFAQEATQTAPSGTTTPSEGGTAEEVAPSQSVTFSLILTIDATILRGALERSLDPVSGTSTRPAI